jgi:hypothetical protein
MTVIRGDADGHKWLAAGFPFNHQHTPFRSATDRKSLPLVNSQAANFVRETVWDSWLITMGSPVQLAYSDSRFLIPKQ